MAKTRLLTKLGLVAGAICAACSGFAFYDTDILIQRALNSPDFTVKYSGAAASMVELRVNGTSVGTQSVTPSKTAGEVVFTLDLLSLNEGDNVVEVRLFDRNGKLLGTQRMNVLADDGTPSPIKLSGVKVGSTVQGPVEIKVGFGREMRNAYVSFFVDQQFKSMTNAAPYTYHWDTLGELNGWHELEAWVVDENSVTYKTRKVRVFVNNPGGRTDRNTMANVPAVINTTTVTTPPKTNVKATGTAVKSANSVKSATQSVKNTVPAVKNAANAVQTAKTTVVDLAPAVNGLRLVTGNAIGFKSGASAKPLVAGSKLMTPKSIPTKLDKLATTDLTNVRNAVDSARTIAIGQGTRLPDMGSFSITMNSKVVRFDVSPRVEGGIPLAPIRHLFEANGGKVDWENLTKTMFGESNGKKIVVKIGDRTATIDQLPVELERAAFLDNGRTIVPLSFIRDSLQVDIEFDPKTGHVLITSVKNKK